MRTFGSEGVDDATRPLGEVRDDGLGRRAPVEVVGAAVVHEDFGTVWEDDGVHDEELVVCLGSAERTVEDGEGAKSASKSRISRHSRKMEEPTKRMPPAGGRVGIIEPDETPDLAVVPLAVFAVRHGVRARGRHRGRRRVRKSRGRPRTFARRAGVRGRPCAERRRRRRPHARVRARRAREERSPLWSNPTLARVARDVKCDFSVPAGGAREAPLAARDIHAATFGEATDPDGQRVPRAATRDYGGVGGDRGRAGARAGAVGGPRPRSPRKRTATTSPSAGQRRAARGAHGAETGFDRGRRANGGRRRPRPPRVARLRRCRPRRREKASSTRLPRAPGPRAGA